MTYRFRDDIEAMYDAVADPSLWPDLLQRIADRVGARGISIFDLRREADVPRLTVTHTSRGFDPVGVQAYTDALHDLEMADHEVFRRHALAGDPIDVIEDDVLVQAEADLFERANVKVLLSHGILHRAAVLLSKDNPDLARFTMQFSEGRGRLSDAEHSYLDDVLPHLAKAIDLGRVAEQLNAVHGHLLAAMDRLRIGIAILDRQGRLIQANEEFRRQLDAHAVMALGRDGRLSFARPEDQRRFADLLGDAMNHGRFGARPRKEVIATSEHDVLCLEATPLKSLGEAGSSKFEGAILYATDTSREILCDPSPMAEVFGLTEAEIHIVALIAEGLTNAQIAERRDRSVSTVNTQVKAILSKTHCNTRTQLLRLALLYGGRFLL